VGWPGFSNDAIPMKRPLMLRHLSTAEAPGPPGRDAPSAQAEARLTPEASSFNQLYVDYAPMVWRGLRRLGVTEESIEDALQDVFIVAHRRLEDFEGRSSLKTWLYGIVVRVAKDYRRARKRRAHRTEALAALHSTGSESVRTPADDAQRREANRVLHAVLAQLAGPAREVFVLIELEELSVREAAAALHLSQRTCQRRLRAAHAAFDEKVALYVRNGGRVP